MRKYNLLEKIRILPSVDQAYSQEFVMEEGGSCCGGLKAEPPAAGGQWGSGGKASAAGGNESGGGAPGARRFLRFFNKNNAYLGLNLCFNTCSDKS